MAGTVRNILRNSKGGIDVEIKHAVFGWMPFTASPDDPEPHGRTLFEELERGYYGIITEIEEEQEP